MKPVVKSQTIRESSLPVLGKKGLALQQKYSTANRYEKYIKAEDGKEKIILKQMVNNNKIKQLEQSLAPKNQHKPPIFAAANNISQTKQAQSTFNIQLNLKEKNKSFRQRSDRYLSNQRLSKELKLPKKLNESSNSSDNQNLAQSLIKDDEHRLAVPTIFVLKKNAEHNLIDQRQKETLFLSQGEGDAAKMISSKNSRSTPSIDNISPLKLAPIYSHHRQEKYIKQKLVGQQAVSKFYNRYKNMDKIKNLQDFRSQFNPITAILTILQNYNIPPKKMELIKVRGHEAILDLHNCALGSSVSLKAVSQILSKVRVFEEIDLSNNNIHGDLCDVIVPNLSRMRKINLADNKIGRRGVQLLSEMIAGEQDCELSELFLQSNHISDSAIGNLFTSLLKIKNLKVLNLSKNWLGTYTAARIKQFLISDVYLTELYLHWCELGTKATKMIFEGVGKNKWLKVLDISWNQIGLDSVPAFCTNNHSLVHLDISFCQIDQADTLEIAEALKDNQTLYGLHYQGNLGYIDFKGYLHAIKKEQKHTPLSIRAGLIQRISSVSIVRDIHISHLYDSLYCRNICWICEGWQQKYFRIAKSSQDKCCFIHFDFQQYGGVLMNDKGGYFQLLRMCPPRQISLFQTKVSNQNIFRHAPCSAESGGINTVPYNNIIHDFMIQHKSFSGVFIENISVIVQPKYYSEIFDDEYVTHAHSIPRADDLKANGDIFVIHTVQKQKVKQKKVLKEPTLLKQIELKQIPEDFQNIFSNKIEQDNGFLKRCVDFDFSHSKIAKIVKNQKDLHELKHILLKNYDVFEKVYYYLANNNPNANGVYSISESRFEKFVEEQGYQSKKMSNIKIRLKVISCLSNHENDLEIQGFYRPQFFQFLLRYAIERWCQKQKNQIEDKHTKKQKAILSIPQAFSKMLKTLRKYEQKADFQRWCSTNLSSYEITIIFKSYDAMFLSIYQSYAGSTQKNMSFKTKKKMVLEECKNIFLNAQIRKTKQTLKDLQIAYRSAKKAQVEDGVADTGLDYLQFLQAFSRFAEGIFLPPIGTEDSSLWERQLIPGQQIPLFLKIQKLLKIVYLSNYDLRNKKMDFILQSGLFAEQIQVLMGCWKEKYDSDKQPARRNISMRMIKLNSLQGSGDSKINLQFLIELLRVKADEIVEENKRKMVEFQMERDAEQPKAKPVQNVSQLLSE